MERDLIKIKYELQDLLDKHMIKDIDVCVFEDIEGKKTIKLSIEV